MVNKMRIFILYTSHLLSLTLAASLIFFSGITFAQWDISGSIAGEVRFFPNEAAFPNQNDATTSPSITVEPELVYQWNNHKDRLTFVPFARWDADDNNRSHVDLREASWLHVTDDWDFVAGISKVFWGVTESRHLVDIINQTDAVENVDGEDKLGQPMINLNLFHQWGTVSMFVLPGFRQRTFPNDNARLRGPLPIDVDNATFESSDKENHVDGAVRWSHTLGQWDIGMAYFRGTSREPRLIPATRNGRTVLVPHYDQIDQTSLDIQLTTESTLWKLEALSRGGQGKRFIAAVAGFEYSFFGVAETSADLGILFEYLYDDRDNTTATIADDDIFIGTRLALNDTQGTTFLIGAIVDRHTQATLLSLEAEHRLSDNWKLEIEGRFFNNIPDASPLTGIREDDYITLRINRFF